MASEVKKILVPVDFSEHSVDALKYAASLAQETKAELIAMHVFNDKEECDSFQEPFSGCDWLTNGHTRLPLDYRFRDKALDLCNFIEKVVGKLGALRIRRRVKIGSSAVKEIIGVAKEENINLIVLAAQKGSLFSYLKARGTFRKLAGRSPCPVILAPAASKERPKPATQLVPRGQATRIGVAMLLALALVGLGGSPASALRPRPDRDIFIPPSDPCVLNPPSGPAQILSFTVNGSVASSTVEFGAPATLSWNVQLPTVYYPPTDCPWLLLTGPGIDPKGREVAPQGTFTVQPLYYSGTYELNVFWGRSGGVLATESRQVTVNLPLDPDDYRCIARASALGQDPHQVCRHKVTINADNLVPLLVQALKTPNTTVIIPDGVYLDLSGRRAIPVRDGVHVLGGRIAEPGKPFRAGPLLYTNARPDLLFDVQGDDVLISGLRIRGADYADESFDGPLSTGILISDVQPSCGQNPYRSCVEIDHNEILGWTHAAVLVHDKAQRIDVCSVSNPVVGITYPCNPSSEPVYIHDNFIHHNQHIGGNGYGVAVDHGAHALIERNVFDWNRHAISEENGNNDSDRLGYRAYRNLVLANGGRNHYDTIFGLHTHQFDMHGSIDYCVVQVLFKCVWKVDHYFGRAGHDYDIRYNSFLYTNGPAIKVRGTPTLHPVGAVVKSNVFAHDADWDDAVQWTEAPPALISDNLTHVTTWGRANTCDFNGDGINDTFIATGQTLWYCPGPSDCVTSSGSGTPTWVYLNSSTKRVEQLGLGHFSADSMRTGVCDVIDGNFISVGGTGPWTPLQ